ncbi:hypothetical protein G443_004061 [Actinoalloteichus cyanogriseus DSM 43889]|uniref:Uncharacterized protein n=1 Tax=Actinoalloteichus caeruleus DSM 43889 TaxID=1120930 RepID=A0ABT1JQ32_ACTCY|nr:hypothetical protein [Actinoalloteichus caeruleus DSM 43889]
MPGLDSWPVKSILRSEPLADVDGTPRITLRDPAVEGRRRPRLQGTRRFPLGGRQTNPDRPPCSARVVARHEYGGEANPTG